jgi:N utilization substance protein A
MNGEKVDIVRWFEDPVEQLVEALKPAVPQNVNLDRDKRRMYFEVKEDDLSVAIGRKGINARPNIQVARMEIRHRKSCR